MRQADSNRTSRRHRLLATITAVCAIPALGLADDSVDGRPLHQVLDEKPADLMLNYFISLADELPHDHAALQSLEDWEQRKVELRSRLWYSLGEFPRDDRPPLNARITGRIDHGDHVVEKVLYESLPGLYVTALVYVPKELDGPAPAVMCVNGHWSGAKSTQLIQERCISLAKMGVIAFCQDVIGTGERQIFSGTPPTTYHGFYRGAAPLIVDRSLLGYIMYECTRGLDYLLTRADVDPQRVMCTGASGGGKQSMFFPALDERLAGGVPVCYVGSYQAHMGATACVGEIPTGILRYSNQWEILALHAPRPLLCINASRDVPVFLPRHMYDALDRTASVYELYGAPDAVRGTEVDSGHDYNREMRQIMYRHVAKHLLGDESRAIEEPDNLPVEPDAALQVGLPEHSETMQSLTYQRARELTAAFTPPADSDEWLLQRTRIYDYLETEMFGGFPDAAQCRLTLIRKLQHNGCDVEHWTLEPEPGILLPAVLSIPQIERPAGGLPAVLVVDEDGKQHSFERGLIDRLTSSGCAVLAVDLRGMGETAGTLPGIEYGPGEPDYNLSNYGLFVGRPIAGMRVFDLRCAADFLLSRPGVDGSGCTLIGRGRAAFAGVLAAGFDDRIQSVVAEDLLTTWVFEEEFLGIGLSYLLPRILTTADMPQLLAAISPRPLLVLNPVDGRRQPVTADAAASRHQFTTAVYALQASPAALQHTQAATDGVPAAIVDWLNEQR